MFQKIDVPQKKHETKVLSNVFVEIFELLIVFHPYFPVENENY